MATAYLGLGANLGDRRKNIDTALEYLIATGRVQLLALSGFRETEPVGGPSQPPYLNAAAAVETDLAPERLLVLLKEAERAAGRSATGVRWGPREADLDLLLYEDLILETLELSLPHPRMRDRLFVLEPLAEIAAEVVDPVTRKTIGELETQLRRRLSGRRNARLARTLEELKRYVGMAQANRFTIGLVPTMGALHEGHLSLVRAARRECDKVVVSIFVNPTQFGPGEDLEKYPRQLDEDLHLVSDHGADLVYAPAVEEMYPAGSKTWVLVEGLSEVLCGASRPDHFRGVTTVVAKLFHQVEPTVAYFGRKDFQQTVIIRKMVRELDMNVEVQVMPTVREADGLALSSRNLYLSPEERERALSLSRGLDAARERFLAGERSADALADIVRSVLSEAGVDAEYVAVVDGDNLEPLRKVTGDAAVLVAARVGSTRLIDNLALEETR